MAAEAGSANAETVLASHTQHALVATTPGILSLAEGVPVPSIELDEVLIKVRAVALNPSDWKLIDNSCTPGAVSGCDCAGTVVRIGGNVCKPLEIGSHVCGIVFGANPSRPANGAFAEYVAAAGDLCIRMPTSMSFEATSSLGAGVMSVGLAIQSLGIDCDPIRQRHTISAVTRPYSLIYGGSTATGLLAIQILHFCGFQVVTTCSPHNFALVKSFGAVRVFDYHSPSCKEDIREFTGGKLKYALDCITDSRSTTICYGAIGVSGGRYTALESYPERLQRRRRDVKPDWVLGWTVFGKAVELGGQYRRDPLPEHRTFAADWVGIIERLLEGRLRTPPIRVLPGGLSSIIPALDTMRKGQVSGMKYVTALESDGRQ
ncbi:hypothetical protein MMC17_007708 [Xylographa soralifera]|nr:hypothetical protein [Xylographa soralifera]